MQITIIDELLSLLKSTNHGDSSIEGILDISRCQIPRDCHSREPKDALSFGGRDNNYCSEDTMITFFAHCKTDPNPVNDANENGVQNKEFISWKWFSQAMLMNNYENLLGPEPMVYLKYVESEQFNVLPVESFGDWYSDNIEVLTGYQKKIQLLHNAESVISGASSSFSCPLNKFLLLYNKKIDQKMSPAIQESLIETAMIGEDEVSILRHYFFSSSFPSRFLSCHNFCTNLCEIILGEMELDRKKDFFRYDL